MWRRLLEIIFPNPSMCVLCEKRTDGLSICDDCLARWQRFAAAEGQCRRCGQFGSRAPICDTCRDWPDYYLGNTAFLPYTDTVREAILRFKYHNEPWRVEGFAALFARCPAVQMDAIVPVPLHKARLRERGYNQSLLLARELSRVWQMPLHDDWLLRVINTRHQVGLSKTERERNVFQAFAVPEKLRPQLQGKRVLLVDDVMTTGSTLLACARALHKAGVKQVQSVTLASAIR